MRIDTNLGDVFSVKLNENEKKYFQLVAFDTTQLNSDVIRAFKHAWPPNSNPDLSDVINGEIEFYAHCVTKLGVKMKLWEKIGNIADIGDTSKILFRDTNDYGKDSIKVSQNWYVWRINDKSFTKVGVLTGENAKADIGIVMNPLGIIERLNGNKYPVNYPDF